ncbi:MAG: hypothetical protein Q8807_03675, partial ['Waltheria sp.' little leaf phytoplasma]|nr:hypothetical protein ['Waltheria sp.' little leaf phytoplasma]
MSSIKFIKFSFMLAAVFSLPWLLGFFVLGLLFCHEHARPPSSLFHFALLETAAGTARTGRS